MEKKKPPICKKCGKPHWRFRPCDVVDIEKEEVLDMVAPGITYSFSDLTTVILKVEDELEKLREKINELEKRIYRLEGFHA